MTPHGGCEECKSRRDPKHWRNPAYDSGNSLNAHPPPPAPIPPGICLSFLVFLSANARDKVKTLFLWLMIEEKSCPSYYKAPESNKTYEIMQRIAFL